MERAESFLEQSKTDEAIVEYRKALQINPKVDNAYEKLGKAYLRIGEVGRASDAFRRAADRTGDDIRLELIAGQYALLGGQFEEAQQRAEHVLEQDPTNTDALALLANALAGLKQFDAAVEAFQRAFDAAPLDAAAYTNLGLLQLAAGQRSEAAAAFRHGAALHAGQGSAGGGGGGGGIPFRKAMLENDNPPAKQGNDGNGGDDSIDPPPTPSGYIIDEHLDLGGGGPQGNPPGNSGNPGNPPSGKSLVMTAEVTGGDDPVVEFHAYDEKSEHEVDGFTGSAGSIAGQGSDLAAVPEPGTLMLLGGGLLFVGRSMRQRFRSHESTPTR